MVRENKDVFDVFVNKLPEMVLNNPDCDYTEPMVNFMFNDLVSSQLNKKLFYISYSVAMSEVPNIDNLDE
jgi:hypothetical protein